MAEIVIFTNVERQFQRLEQARKILENDNLSTSSCKSVFFGSESCWNKNYERLVSSASVVLFCWQGAISPNDLSTKSKMFLQSHNTKFAMLSITEPEVDDQKGFKKLIWSLFANTLHIVGLKIINNYGCGCRRALPAASTSIKGRQRCRGTVFVIFQELPLRQLLKKQLSVFYFRVKLDLAGNSLFARTG